MINMLGKGMPTKKVCKDLVNPRFSFWFTAYGGCIFSSLMVMLHERLLNHLKFGARNY